MSNSGQLAHSHNKNNNEPIPFKKGDIVWAKVRGYSWWPAKVRIRQINHILAETINYYY
jgi:hypothetical protein